MTSIGFGGGANMMRLLQQQLFAQIDGNSDGAISKTEMETAVGDAGGTTEEADALFDRLDTSGSGSVNAEQFVSGLKSSLIGDGTTAQLVGMQEVGHGRGSGHHHGDSAAVLSNLFSSIDSDGDGSVTKSELEDAVTNAGGTTDQVDALYGKLDPDDSGSVTEAEFTQVMMPPMMGPPPPPPGASGAGDDASDVTAAATSDSTSDSATSALKLLLDALEEARDKSTSASASDDHSSDAFQQLLDSLDASSSDETDTRSGRDPNLSAAAAQRLVQHYLQASSPTAATGSTVSAVA